MDAEHLWQASDEHALVGIDLALAVLAEVLIRAGERLPVAERKEAVAERDRRAFGTDNVGHYSVLDCAEDARKEPLGRLSDFSGSKRPQWIAFAVISCGGGRRRS